ncbi:MAG: transposase [Clostridia bacterium]|nr:transposase [Clostridia bacterium]
MNFPKRKPNRLPNYDYSRSGAYFITVCTKDKACIFWDDAGATIGRPQLSQYGEIVNSAILNIETLYPYIRVDKYVVMPNHVHILLMCDNGRAMHAPTISTVIQQFKGAVSKTVGSPVWQKSFHDHIIRNQQDYNNIWTYIDTNPLKWENDCFYL